MKTYSALFYDLLKGPEVLLFIVKTNTQSACTYIGLPTKKSKVLRFQICCTRTMYLSEIYKNRTIKVGAAKLFSVNSSRT